MIQRKYERSIYTQLANKYQLPSYVIEVICNSPFGFSNRHITQDNDKSIMMTYLGKFKKKRIYLNDVNKTDK